LVGTHVARPRPSRHRRHSAFGALFLSLAFAAPTALLGLASPAAADIGAPDRASVPAEIESSASHALPGDATNVRIDMTENDGLNVIAAGSGGTVSAPGAAGVGAVLFQPAGNGLWTVFDGPGCSGPWTQVALNQTNPTASPVGGLLTLCVAGYSPTVHGTLTGMYNSLGQARSVNTLPLEQYVADTTPGESPSSWAGLGGAGPQGMDWGFQELEAQSVAVRSYVLASLGGYGGYADTCDLTCQTYRGTEFETPTSIAAADDTAGQVMIMPNGQIATTEYSASTGGYTSSANEESPFTAVPDDGDGVCIVNVACNPNHTWSTSVSFAAIQTAWPQIGTFTGFGGAAFDPGRPYNESSFGRVASITLNGTSESIMIPGTEFYVDLGLKSDLFSVTGQSTNSASIIGQGWGHGIGMGQWGALGYAIGQDNGDGNWTYQQIVSHYYGPATLGSLPGGTTLIGDQLNGGVGGYWINAADGGVFSFGNAQFYGSTGGMRLNQPVVAIASTHDAAGYWEVASDGGVFSFGDAPFHGSTGSIRLNKPVVGMATTPDGGGYWLVASDGGIFAYGDAQFYGSTGSLKLNKPVIGMVPTHDGGGYWLIASDGGLFAFGDAQFYGSLGSAPPPTPIVGVAPSPDGGGYWMLETSGTPHAFGDAPSVALSASSPGLSTMKSPMTGLIPDFSGQGFDAVNGSGQAFAYGDAPYFGDVTTAVPGYSGHTVGIAATPG
jgi:SpoIID/LytB domain protein